MLLTMPLKPAVPFLSVLASRIRSSSSWNTMSTPWYASAAEISKKPQSADRARSRPSSLDTARLCCRSRLFPTMRSGAELESFCCACRMCWTCCLTTLKLARSQMLYTRMKPSDHCSCRSLMVPTSSAFCQRWEQDIKSGAVPLRSLCK